MSEELESVDAQTHEYSMKDFVKMMNLKKPRVEGQDDEEYQDFINRVPMKVRELDDEYT